MSDYQINIASEDIQFKCSDQQNLLEGMTRLGIKGIPVGCRGGGCGVCKVRIIDGDYTTKKMSRSQVTEKEEHDGFVLACRCMPQSDLSLKVIGAMKKCVEKSVGKTR